jgi:hypothetical protein
MWEGAIEVVTQSGGTWSAPTELVPRATRVNHYYPAFSPDNNFIVYNVSTCPSSVGPYDGACNADTNPSARLWAILAGGGTPVELAKANAGGKRDGSNTDLTTTFPKWSPFVFRRGVELGTHLEWVTFASKRYYGLRLPPIGSRGTNGTYIWMAAVDPDKVAQGVDPSSPAFALPYQDVTTSNHIPQWATQVIPPIQ